MTWYSINEPPQTKPIYNGGPEDSGYLLVWNGSFVTLGHYGQVGKKRTFKWKSDVGWQKITHWTPMPEGPKP